jgi:hypothetical protein
LSKDTTFRWYGSTHLFWRFFYTINMFERKLSQNYSTTVTYFALRQSFKMLWKFYDILKQYHNKNYVFRKWSLIIRLMLEISFQNHLTFDRTSAPNYSIGMKSYVCNISGESSVLSEQDNATLSLLTVFIFPVSVSYNTRKQVLVSRKCFIETKPCWELFVCHSILHYMSSDWFRLRSEPSI